MKQCPKCKKIFEDDVQYCSECGFSFVSSSQPSTSGSAASSIYPPLKNKFTAVVLCLFLGFLGIHRMYLGYYRSGFVIFFCNLLLFWTIITPIVIFLVCMSDLSDIVHDDRPDSFGRYLVP